MARRPKAHASRRAAPRAARDRWYLSGESRLNEDEPTKKVPDYLVDFARWLGEDPESDTQPMSRGAARAHPVSGIVPALSILAPPPAEVVPPPPRPARIVTTPLPAPAPLASTLAAFTRASVPFLAPAENEHGTPVPRVTRRPSTLRANVTQSIVAAIIALAAVLVLFALGTKPVVVVEPSARTAVTVRARADHADHTAIRRAPRATRIETPPPPAVPLPSAAPPPPAPAPLPPPKPAARIIRNAPF
jgi:hypothetical protein